MKTSTDRVAQLRAELAGLLECCPVEGCNPADCPLFKVRRLGPVRRQRWFAALSEEDLEYLASYHYTCERLKLTPLRDADCPAVAVAPA